jgi:hypothetical protein
VRNRTEFVPANKYDEMSAQYDQTHRQLRELAAVVCQVAWVTPRPGAVQRTWQSLRSRAEAALTS